MVKQYLSNRMVAAARLAYHTSIDSLGKVKTTPNGFRKCIIYTAMQDRHVSTPNVPSLRMIPNQRGQRIQVMQCSVIKEPTLGYS